MYPVSTLTVLSHRVVSFEACCEWALLSVQLARPVTLPYCSIFCKEVHVILMSVKCMLGLFVLP